MVLLNGPYGGGATIKNIETLQIGQNVGGTVNFDYNVNNGAYEVTGVNKVVYDQINNGEGLSVNNITPTSATNTTPVLSWENEAGSRAGTVTATYRQASIAGTNNQDVVLSNINAMGAAADGILNIGGGIETITINSTGTVANNTLNNSLNADTTVYAVAADVISAGTLTKVVLTGDVAIGKAAGVVTATTAPDSASYGLTDRLVGVDTGLTADAATNATESNLLSVGARVTEVDASAAAAGVNVRFVARTDSVATNVTFKGGAGNDYVEFEVGDITATGGAGNDTFAFINTQNNSTLTTTDSIVGGAGVDTIQLGVNGNGTYNLETTEFNNKTGIDVLDLRGQTNTIKLSDAFVTGSDAGLTVRTDKIIQTSATSTANDTVTTTNNLQENQSVNTIDVTALAANRALDVIGGSGSDRLLVNEVALNGNVKFDGGTNAGNNAAGTGATAGDYDTLTVVNSAVLSRGDLVNVKGVEGIVLTENTTGNSAFTIELTEAFLLANTAGTNSGATSIDDRVLQIITAAAANGNALGAGDTVRIDVTDLFSNGALKGTLAARQIDVNGVLATVTFVNNGVVVAPAALGTLLGADAARADVANSGASVAAVAVAVPVALAAAGTFTGTAGVNDTFTGTIASLVGTTVTGTVADVETLTITDAGVLGVPAAVTNIDVLNLANGANTVTFAAGIASVNGGTGNDTVTLFADATADASTVTLGAGADNLNLVAGRTYTGTFAGGDGTDTLTPGAVTVVNATVTGFDTLITASGSNISVGANVLLTQFSTINSSAAGAADQINITGGTHDVTGVTWGTGIAEAQNITFNLSTGASLTIGGDAMIGTATAANEIWTGAGTANLTTTAALTLTGATDTIPNVTFGTGGFTVTDDGALARTFNMGTGVNTLAIDATGVVGVLATVNNFTVGAAGDVIDLNANGITTSEVVVSAISANISAGNGLTTTTIANLYHLTGAAFQVATGSLTSITNGAAVETAILAAALDAGAATAGEVYVTLDDGVSTGIYRLAYTDSGDAGFVLNLASEIAVTHIATLVGVADNATFNDANFV